MKNIEKDNNDTSDNKDNKELTTLVFGASLNPDRYSNMAVQLLDDYNHDIKAIGGKKGSVKDIDILTGHPKLENIHTITMYMGAERAEEHIDYLLSLNPKRIIFNPGAENANLAMRARQQGIEVEEACTLVLLRTGQYS